MSQLKTKTFTNSYLYNKGNNEAMLFNFIMKADRIDTSDPSFEDIRYDVKRRQVSNSLVKVLDSKDTILLKGATPLPKAFKSFVAKDVREDKTKSKIFIDADIISIEDGSYYCHNVDMLVAYLISGANAKIYYLDPKRLLLKTQIINSGAKCFSILFTHVIDYLFKISNIGNSRDKCIYLSSMYYLVNILGKDVDETTKRICAKLSGLSSREEEILLMYIDEDTFDNIKIFVDSVAEILNLSKLTLDAFVDKWLFLYGSGTQYALELYPSFATMMTNVYVGCYLNNQKTIEKLTGKNMVEFSLAILKEITNAVG